MSGIRPETESPSSCGHVLEALAVDDTQPRFLKANAVLYRVNQRIEHVFLVRSGCICLHAPGGGARQVLIREVKPFGIIGLAALSQVGSQRALHTATARVDSEVLEIPRPSYLRALRANPEIAIDVLAYLCDRLATTEQRVSVLARRSAERRLALLLVQLSELSGAQHTQRFVRIPYTHAELAGMAGLSRCHVSVLMADFRERTLVRYKRNTHPEVDVHAFEELASS